MVSADHFGKLHDEDIERIGHFKYIFSWFRLVWNLFFYLLGFLIYIVFPMVIITLIYAMLPQCAKDWVYNAFSK